MRRPNHASTQKTLRRKWGADFERNMTAARDTIEFIGGSRKGAARLRDFLEFSGLGDSVALIEACAAYQPYASVVLPPSLRALKSPRKRKAA